MTGKNCSTPKSGYCPDGGKQTQQTRAHMDLASRRTNKSKQGEQVPCSISGATPKTREGPPALQAVPSSSFKGQLCPTLEVSGPLSLSTSGARFQVWDAWFFWRPGTGCSATTAPISPTTRNSECRSGFRGKGGPVLLIGASGVSRPQTSAYPGSCRPRSPSADLCLPQPPRFVFGG